jgi:hypothetical protein
MARRDHCDATGRGAGGGAGAPSARHDWPAACAGWPPRPSPRHRGATNPASPPHTTSLPPSTHRSNRSPRSGSGRWCRARTAGRTGRAGRPCASAGAMRLPPCRWPWAASSAWLRGAP